MTPALLPLLLAGAGIGVVLVLIGLAGPRDRSGIPTRRVRALRLRLTRRQLIQLAVGAVAGAAVAVFTGWWVLVVAVPLAVVGLPWLLQKGPQEKAIRKLDALESWTRSLGGLTSSGAGLERTIAASLSSCPEAIRPEVTRLIGRLNARWSASDALQAFADDLDDETGDVLVLHLLRKAELSGAGLGEALDDLASSMFARVKVRRQIEADRAAPRNEVRYVVYFTIALLVALVIGQQYSHPYGTLLGQLLLTVYLGLYVLALIWMRQISRGHANPRMLARTEDKPGEK